MATRPTPQLTRFVDAQASCYERVVAELEAGRKRSHWMWYVFPQIAGLGISATSRIYAIGSIDEARAYLSHPVLGPRLRECTSLVLDHPDSTLRQIFGTPDDLKFRSSMTLFARAGRGSSDAALFERALDTFCNGEPDPRTLDLLEAGRHGA